MSNPLVSNNAGGKNTTAQAQDMNTLFQQFKKNPLEFLIKSKLNIPQNVGSNPQAIVQHLYNSGQIPKQILPRVQQMLGMK